MYTADALLRAHIAEIVSKQSSKSYVTDRDQRSDVVTRETRSNKKYHYDHIIHTEITEIHTDVQGSQNLNTTRPL